MTADRSASVMARLLNRSRSKGENSNLILARFVIERLLFRLSVSPHAGTFVLKGAMLFALWYDEPHRPTKDADLLGFGSDDADTLHATFADVCGIEADDGVRYDSESIRVAPIREDTIYGGLRLTVTAQVGNARLPVQVDIGFGDVITPASERIQYPTLLKDMGAPCLRAYPVYTVIAEELHAMVLLGINNTRMKDFFDLMVIARSSELDGDTLVEAPRATFQRRATALPALTPTALTPAFGVDPTKVKQLRAFLTKARLGEQALEEVVARLGDFLLPPMRVAATGAAFGLVWFPSSGEWSNAAAATVRSDD